MRESHMESISELSKSTSLIVWCPGVDEDEL